MQYWQASIYISSRVYLNNELKWSKGNSHNSKPIVVSSCHFNSGYVPLIHNVSPSQTFTNYFEKNHYKLQLCSCSSTHNNESTFENTNLYLSTFRILIWQGMLPPVVFQILLHLPCQRFAVIVLIETNLHVIKRIDENYGLLKC